jgi:hypothetical protein
MFDSGNPASVLVPMLAVILLTFLAVIRMGAGRAKAMKSGMDAKFYRTYTGGQEPDTAIIGVRHYHNLLELPTIFYPACITAFALGAVGMWTLIFAWGYVVARLVQSAVHLGHNHPGQRGGAYMLGVVMVLALWINVAVAVFARF